jgi:hypothetical protein
MRFAVFACLCFGIPSGCTSVRLKHSVINQSNTLAELQYQQVLSNLAMFSENPWALPSHVSVRDGSAQISDVGQASTTLDAHRAWVTHPGLLGSRTVVEQWGMGPVTDDIELRIMQIAYRNALGYVHEGMDVDLANDLAFEFAKQTAESSDIDLRNQDIELTTYRSAFVDGYAKFSANKIFGIQKERSSQPPPTPDRNLPPAIPPDRIYEQFEDQYVSDYDVLSYFNTYIRSLYVTTNDDRIISDLETGKLNGIDSYAYHEIVEPPGGFDLLWMGSVKDTEAIPKEAKSLIVVARVDHRLYFRIFDANGKTVLDVSEEDMLIWIKRKGDPLSPLGVLELQLRGFQPANIPLPRSDAKPIIEQMIKYVWHPRQASPLARYVRRKVKDVAKDLDEVPTLWFGIGGKWDVPPDACYVGRYKNRYAWVCPGGRKQLSDFTIKMLNFSSLIKESAVITIPGGPRFTPSVSGR